ncbi:MAG: SDR family NAD(P)-dependent oxidoreductase [Nitrospiraceae bacterium]|nr:MAG: SDR family NAD(P)-dependent oxidoreductase [Nitrospiraceae bacterium]
MVCIVTGSSRGLGKSIALAFGMRKYSVAVHYHKDREGAEKTAGGIDDAIVIKGELRNKDEAEMLVKSVVDKWDMVDVLVNNAGITNESLLIKTSEEVFTDVMHTNLKGPFHMTKAVGRQMMKQRRGHIVNIASYAGIKGKEGLSAYASSKAALTGLTRSAALELGRYNIMVNTVLPGYMLTDMGSASSSKAKDRAVRDGIVKGFSEPLNTAEFICYLVNTTGITGQVFNLDSRII